MTSGLDVYLEESNAKVSVAHNLPFPKVVTKNKSEPVLYFVRINNKGLSWGKIKQIDDNIIIRFDPDTNKVIGVDIL